LAAKPQTPREVFAEAFAGMDKDALADLALAVDEIERKMADDGPKTEDELWYWVRDNLGISIPRKPVCKGHQSPFDFLSACYFRKYPAILGMGNRGGGKTFMVALLHWLNSTFFPGIESATFGATEAQSLRCYAHLRNWIYDKKTGERKPQIRSSVMRKTEWKSGSAVEVLPGTPEGVNGPHPQIAHGDEVELMRQDTWDESQPIDTLIPTPTGLRRMGDLELGDEVLGRDGKPTRVTKIFELGEREVFQVGLTDGRTTRCCDDHLWFVAGQAQRERGVWKTMRLSEIRAQGVKLKSSYRFFIPQAESVELSETELIVDPYTLGVILGDGFIGRTGIEFRSIDPEVVENVNRRGGWQVTSTVDGEHEKHRLVGKNVHGLSSVAAFTQLGLAGRRSGDKFIPAGYLCGSRQARLDLLRGLMDTDGCAIDGSPVGQFATISEQLADDLRSLVFSLGGRAIKRTKNFSSSWSNGTLYSLDISFADDTEMFALPRKLQRVEVRQRTLDPAIKSIEPAGMATCRCIGVDNQDESYLTTDYIVTHNSRNMAVSKTIPDEDGGDPVVYPSMEILTSTRKGLRGRMQQLIDGIDEAKRQGKIPDYTLIIWCIFEIAQEQPDCQKAPDDEREARLKELGLDPCQLCDCDKHMKGTWPNRKDENERPLPRLLSDVCRGRLFHSRGFLPYEDVVQKFKQNSQATWEAQQECSKPETEHNYLQGLDEALHGLRNFMPDPGNGKIYLSVDWGYDNPSAVNWYQLLEYPVEAEDFEGRPVVVKAGTLVCFDEIYVSEVGATKLAKMVKAREAEWKRMVKGWEVALRFPDPQGAMARGDWKDQGLKTVFKTTRDFGVQMEWLLGEYWEEDKVRVDVVRCPMWYKEAQSWQRDPKNPDKQLDDFNHCMSNFRYCVANIRSIYRRRSRGKSKPTASRSGHRTQTVVRDTRRALSGPVAIYGGPRDDWRKRLGGPAGWR
jgi:hypothetical protein